MFVIGYSKILSLIGMGYHPLSFFAIKAAYSADTAPRSEIDEFKDMVKALHAAGIEVILDVVYNHTGEGNHLGPTFSMKGIDNCSYYMLSEDRCYMNFSGCGNTVNCNHPYVRNFILDSLRYWVTEMHVDGFRFDLASILGRDQSGNVLASPPLLEQIAGDPVLADTKLIAEAWDAAGLYQVGTFPNWGHWAEWNGRFRDDIRRFVCGAPGMARSLATRLAGSSDLFQHGREPGHGINFITSHDGFRAGAPDWSDESRSLAMHLSGNTPRGPAPDMYLIANAHWESHDFELPSPCIGTWHRFIDTSMRGDDAIVDDPGMHPLDYPASYLVSARSTVVLIAM